MKAFRIFCVVLLMSVFLVACGKDETITMSFDANGGSPVSAQEVNEGDILEIPDTSREGFTLEGWYTSVNGGETFEEKWLFASSIVRRELTLYAKWVPNAYQVTFDGRGADGGDALDPHTVTYGQPYGDLPDPERTGHTFLGWSDDLETENMVSFDSTVTRRSDHTLFAVWQVRAYQMTFDPHGGSLVETITQDYDTNIDEPDPPIRIGHTFAGWFRDEEMTIPYVFDTMPAEDVTLHAKWQINQYTITFDSKQGTPVSSITQDYDTDVSEPEDPDRTGYIFMGWYVDDTFDHAYVFDKVPAENITLYALWYATITFESNGGSFVEPIRMRAGENIDEPDAPTKEGYTFIEWYRDEALTEAFVFQTMPETSMTLYAKWQTDRYVVTFDTHGGLPMDPATLEHGTSLDDHIPIKAGDLFQGWYLEDTYDTEIDVVPMRNVTIHAKWVLDISMVMVGEADMNYLMPTGTDDNGTANVDGGYMMATGETTYELWYEVRVWAAANGYSFQNTGKEGSSGSTGQAPSDASKHEPVTNVSWRDVVVWTNALSEMTGLDPVYRTSNGKIIRDSRDSNGDEIDDAIQTENNGYRLPTTNEWEMAARWRNSGGTGTISIGGRNWTPGDHASGATAEYDHSTETGQVAWYVSNSGGDARSVQEKSPNHLGIFDMSGNVWEWCFEWYPGKTGWFRIGRGGSYADHADHLQVGHTDMAYQAGIADLVGFRIVRNP